MGYMTERFHFEDLKGGVRWMEPAQGRVQWRC